MGESYQFGTGTVATGASPVKSQYPLDFSKAPILGNAGAKINAFLYGDLLDPTVADRPPGANAPGGEIKITTPLAVRNPRKLLTKVLRAGIGEAGGTGDELLPYQLPDGRILTPEQWAARIGRQAEVGMPAMWLSDP